MFFWGEMRQFSKKYCKKKIFKRTLTYFYNMKTKLFAMGENLWRPMCVYVCVDVVEWIKKENYCYVDKQFT